MLSDLTRLNYILFQLVKYNLDTKDSKEILVTSLAVFPSMIVYQYSSRTAINQTIGGNEVDGFADKYGRGLTKVQVRGTFGNRSRLTGTEWKSGWTRLIEFRELVFKLSNLQEGQSKRKIAAVNTLKYSELFPKQNEVLGVNFFDFYNNEKFSINIDQFQVIEDVSRNNLPAYMLNLTELGDVIETDTNDPVLSVLLAAENVLGEVVANIDNLLSKIEGNNVLNTVTSILTAYNVGFTAMGAGLMGAKNMMNLGSEIKNLLTGKTFHEKVSGWRSVF